PSLHGSSGMEIVDGRYRNPATWGGAVAPSGDVESAQGQPQLAGLLVHAAGDGIPDPVPGLSAGPRYLDFVHGCSHRPDRPIHRARELRMAAGRSDILA